MTEISQVWHQFRKHVAPLGHLTRIESPTELGIPDVAYTLRGVSGWVENKLFDRGPNRCPTHLTLSQVMWGEAEVAAGGRWYLFGRSGTIWLLYDIADARALLEGTVPSPTPILRMTGRFPTRELLQVLAPPDQRAK